MSSSRRRLGVALLLDPPVSDEIDGMRRALGDPSFGRIPAHLTLVPPVNVRAGDLEEALARLRAAASLISGPLRLTLGPPTTFLPDNPVLYLSVGGDFDRLRGLRDAVFQPPLERKLSWSWVPHVTLADGIAEDRIGAALAALDKYAAVASFDRVVMLEEGPGRVWTPMADAALEAATVVGAGGLELQISRGRLVGPEARHAMEMAETVLPDAQNVAPEPSAGGSFPPIVLTCRREGAVVGISAGWIGADGGHVGVWVRPGERRQGIGTHLLHHLESALHRAGWGYAVLAADGPDEFYRARSSWSVAAPTRSEPTRTGPAS